MELRLDEIYIGGRLREEYDLQKDLHSFRENGQLQSILVRGPREDEHTEGKPWVLVDGGRRFFIFQELYSKGETVKGVSPGHILANTRESATPLQALVWEFQANDNRKNFTWKEVAEYVRRIHEMMQEQSSDWTVELTGQLLRMGTGTVYKYLQLTSDEEIFRDPSVQAADSFNTAYKKATITKEKKRRKKEAAHHTKTLEKELSEEADGDEEIEPVDVESTYHRFANLICEQADCREWVKRLPDESVDFIHWDPPYGNRGFAHSTHDYFEDTWEYASALMADMFAEGHRILKDGHWMAIWFTPHHAEWVKRRLQGHEMGLFRKKDDYISCINCGARWDALDDFLPCRDNPTGFWVNPIPYIWYKPDRAADGHEIKRFSLNQYEPFYLCAKYVDREPILVDSSSSNVLVHNQIPKGERRHPTHKPPSVLMDIIQRISVPGELGVDFSIGSGSIFEAAIPLKRRMNGCELDEGHHLAAIEVIRPMLIDHGIKNFKGWKSE